MELAEPWYTIVRTMAVMVLVYVMLQAWGWLERYITDRAKKKE